jgi:hypothetical protein
MKIIRVLKKFEYKGVEFRIALVERPYMNSDEPIQIREVLAPNGGILPVYNYNHRTPLKEIMRLAKEAIDKFESLGVDIVNECTKELQLWEKPM